MTASGRRTPPPKSVSPEIVAALERELQRRPRLSLGVLQHFAAGIDPEIAHMDPRRFHAEYVVRAWQGIAQKHHSGRRSGPKQRQRVRSEPPSAVVHHPPLEKTPAPAMEAPAPPPPVELLLDRAPVRVAFLAWAEALAAANTRAEWVRVLTRVDDYAERALSGDGRGSSHGYDRPKAT